MLWKQQYSFCTWTGKWIGMWVFLHRLLKWLKHALLTYMKRKILYYCKSLIKLVILITQFCCWLFYENMTMFLWHAWIYSLLNLQVMIKYLLQYDSNNCWLIHYRMFIFIWHHQHEHYWQWTIHIMLYIMYVYLQTL